MLSRVEGNSTLAATAYWTAAVRAQESQRPDGLFHDPWAGALAGSPGQAWISERTPASVLPIVLRTRFFDDFLQQMTADQGIRQVVLLAAGLDTRGFRLPWPQGTRLFELEQEDVLAHKEEILKAAQATPTCWRAAVAVDLTDTWEAALTAAGFDARSPAVWLLEGFLFYLSTPDLTRLLARVLGFAAPGSAIGLDIINSLTLTSPLTQKWVQMQADAGAPWIGSLDDPETLLTHHGWQVSLSAPGAPDANYGRWSLPIIPVQMAQMPHLWYVTGRKKQS